jgi:DNA repair protein RecO (recombination protein O)
MEERASGIILRTRPLTETSLIVQWLTTEQGRISTVAKGARRPKSPFSGKLDLFYDADFSFVRSRKSELHTLREVVLRDAHAAIRQDLDRLSAAAYGAVLIEHGTEHETPIPEFHQLFKDLLTVLNTRGPSPAVAFSLELKFLELSGAAVAVEDSSPELIRLLQALTNISLDAAAQLVLPTARAHYLSSLLRRAIGTNLERLPPQRDRFLQKVLSS